MVPSVEVPYYQPSDGHSGDQDVPCYQQYHGDESIVAPSMLWDHGTAVTTMVPYYRGTMVPWYWVAMVSPDYDTMVPPTGGTMEP